jgi:hypothetical protein
METLLQENFGIIEEVQILSDVRLVGSRDLNPLSFTDYIKVQFEIIGEVKGHIFCYLDLEDKELSIEEKNYLLPLFLESMNILLGQQLSRNYNTSGADLRLTPPKIVSSKSLFFTNGKRRPIQKYSLELRTMTFDIAIEYNLERMN